jgi:prophage antirepressor-like protein
MDTLSHSPDSNNTSTTVLNIFNYEQREVRTIIDEHGKPWWVANDVCIVLDIKDAKQAIDRLDEDERGRYTVPTPGGNQMMTCINEPGLYELIFTSRKPEAKAFKRWIKQEVLPAIRKTGSYSFPQSTPQRQLPPPIWNMGADAILAKPLCPCPTREQAEVLLLQIIQWLEPFYPEGLSIADVIMHSQKLQAYYKQHNYADEAQLLIIAESFVERHMLTRTESPHGGYFYKTVPVTGYVH